jgi:hypothetical protein
MDFLRHHGARGHHKLHSRSNSVLSRRVRSPYRQRPASKNNPNVSGHLHSGVVPASSFAPLICARQPVPSGIHIPRHPSAKHNPNHRSSHIQRNIRIILCRSSAFPPTSSSYTANPLRVLDHRNPKSTRPRNMGRHLQQTTTHPHCNPRNYRRSRMRLRFLSPSHHP